MYKTIDNTVNVQNCVLLIGDYCGGGDDGDCGNSDVALMMRSSNLRSSNLQCRDYW